MRRSLRVSTNAARQVIEAARWWHANRSAAPNLLRDEVQRGFEFVSADPSAGTLANDPRVEGLRRLHLPRIRYFIFYRSVTPDIVEVLAFWHTSRGTPPEL